MSAVTLHHGDALAVLRTMPDASVDAVVTDPPYGLAEHKTEDVTAALVAWCTGDREHVPDGRGFMGRAWDAFVPPPAVWDECLRVLKPGGHLLCFAGSRTVDLMGISIRLAGFQMRDDIMAWLYGSGFPKSLDVSKAIDAQVLHGGTNSRRIKAANASRPGEGRTRTSTTNNGIMGDGQGAKVTRDDPATDAARQWQGWGTALKPASEPIIVARKPLSGTVAANVLAHGTGALNIDGCRVLPADAADDAAYRAKCASVVGLGSNVTGAAYGEFNGARVDSASDAGRWPSNVVFTHAPECGPEEAPGPCVDGCPVAELNAQSGWTTSDNRPRLSGTKARGGLLNNTGEKRADTRTGHADAGGASRFFPTFRYQAKAPGAERPRVDGVMHPTVKPLALMRWLVRLVTPPGGTVLDHFAGSGTTGEACAAEGFPVILIEREAAYLPLIVQRLGAVA